MKFLNKVSVIPVFFLLYLITDSCQQRGEEQEEGDVIDPFLVKCLVCNSVIEEVEANITNVKPTLKANVGGYQLDNEGNVYQKQVPYSHSTLYLSELMDNVCSKMEDYVRAKNKLTGELILMPLVIDGVMNSKMSEVDLVQDSDLNKSLKYYCEEIVSEYEDIIIDLIQARIENLKYKICTQESEYCKYVNTHDEL